MNQGTRRGGRRQARQRRQRPPGISTTTIALFSGAAVIIILALGMLFWPDGNAEASFEPVESLEYEYSPNHLHGIGYDHVEDRLFLASHFGLFSLEGDQLYQVGNERSDLMGFSMNPNEPAEIYVSGHPQGGGNLGVLRSEDAGLNFEQISTGIDEETVDFHAMTISAADPNWFYGAFMGQIYRSEDGGENFTAIQPEGLPETGLCWGAPCLEAGGGDPETVLAGTQQGLMKSTDGAQTWELVNNEIGQVAALRVDPDDPDRIIAYTESMGLALSDEGGESWESRHGDLATGEGGYVFAIALDRDDPDRMFVATMNNEVFETTDGGETWNRVV